MNTIKETTIDKLTPDDRNFNQGTEWGEHLMDESLRRFGLGRSILIDKHDRIIAGNKTHEKAGALGFERVVVVETDGHTLVAVKRTDVDLDSPQGRELALADNATGLANLAWDEGAIRACAEAFDFSPEAWGVRFDWSEPHREGNEEGEDGDGADASEPSEGARLIVRAEDVEALHSLRSELMERGFEAELLD